MLEQTLARGDIRVSVRVDLMASLIEANLDADRDRPQDASAQLAATRGALVEAWLSSRTRTTSVLNAGITAATHAPCGSASLDTLNFARDADSSLTTEDVITEEDRYRRALLHLAIRAFDSPLPDLHSASARIAGMHVAPSLSADPDNRLHDLERSAHRVLQLRSGADDAVFVIADAAGRGHVVGGAGGVEVPVVFVIVPACQVALVSASLPAPGGSVEWDQHDDGTALFVGPAASSPRVLVWVPAWPGSTGLFSEPRDGERSDFRRPGLASAVAADEVLLVLSGSGLAPEPLRLVPRTI